MADIATIWDPAAGRGDWAMPSGATAFAPDAGGRPLVDAAGLAVLFGPHGALPGAGLVSDRDLETAVLLSIGTDAVAGPDDGEADPRGWWGDATIGCRLWLRRRAKRTPATLALAKADIEGALGWLLTDGVAAAVDVTTEWAAGGRLACRIVVRRAVGGDVALAYSWAWESR